MIDTYLVPCPACGAKNRVPASREGEHGKCGMCKAPLPALHTSPVVLDDHNFDTFILHNPGAVIAEFWAPW